MPIRLRKFIGAIALFVLVTVWALVAMALAQVAGHSRQHARVDRLLRDCRHRLGIARDADRGMDEPGKESDQNSETEKSDV